MLSVLPLLSWKVHEIHQQERIHHVRGQGDQTHILKVVTTTHIPTQSTSFCKSARDAFNLLMRNLVRVVVLDSVVDFLLFLGKIVIVLLTGAVSYLAFAGYMPDIKDQIPSLNYIYTPVVFIVIGSYVIAR